MIKMKIANIEDSIGAPTQRHADYLEKCGERLITATRNNTDHEKTKKNKNKINRRRNWRKTKVWTF